MKINPLEVTIGITLYHHKIGKLIVEGISPHCGNYAIDYTNDRGITAWVYLGNCKLTEK